MCAREGVCLQKRYLPIFRAPKVSPVLTVPCFTEGLGAAISFLTVKKRQLPAAAGLM